MPRRKGKVNDTSKANHVQKGKERRREEKCREKEEGGKERRRGGQRIMEKGEDAVVGADCPMIYKSAQNLFFLCASPPCKPRARKKKLKKKMKKGQRRKVKGER